MSGKGLEHNQIQEGKGGNGGKVGNGGKDSN